MKFSYWPQPARWYEFWNPMSGFPGGAIAGSVISVFILFVNWLV